MCYLNLTFYWLRALSFCVLLESFRRCVSLQAQNFFSFCTSTNYWRIKSVLNTVVLKTNKTLLELYLSYMASDTGCLCSVKAE